MKILVLSSLVMWLCFGSCIRSRDHSPLVGKYELQGYEYSGELIFKGAISLTALDNNQVQGNCKVVKTAEAFQGAVDKDGPCEGKVSGSKITLDLAPGFSDGGLVFEGQWTDARIEGTWRIESMAGAKTFGTFQAIKQ
ncbi:MAG: hypothetical protein WAM70_00305 [Pyrinomonadaceae bacterium]